MVGMAVVVWETRDFAGVDKWEGAAVLVMGVETGRWVGTGLGTAVRAGKLTDTLCGCDTGRYATMFWGRGVRNVRWSQKPRGPKGTWVQEVGNVETETCRRRCFREWCLMRLRTDIGGFTNRQTCWESCPQPSAAKNRPKYVGSPGVWRLGFVKKGLFAFADTPIEGWGDISGRSKLMKYLVATMSEPHLSLGSRVHLAL